eukprot:COSAG01_NODE_2249_length_8073_cov_2.946973_7_plen_53_part_00
MPSLYLEPRTALRRVVQKRARGLLESRNTSTTEVFVAVLVAHVLGKVRSLVA